MVDIFLKGSGIKDFTRGNNFSVQTFIFKRLLSILKRVDYIIT